MESPSPYAEVIDVSASSFPLGVVVSFLALPFAVVAGWAVARRVWPVFTPMIVVVVATAVFLPSVGTWALLLVSFVAGLVPSSVRRTRGTRQHAVD